MIFPVPSIDPHEGSGTSCRTAGAEAGQSRANTLLDRLARKYWFAITAGLTLPPIVAFASVLPLTPLGAVIVATFTAAVLFYIFSVLTEFHADLKTAKRLWDEREERICNLTNELDHAEQDAEHWKAISFTKRGGLTVVKEDTAAGLNAEREKPAADVVQLHKTDGGL